MVDGDGEQGLNGAFGEFEPVVEPCVAAHAEEEEELPVWLLGVGEEGVRGVQEHGVPYATTYGNVVLGDAFYEESLEFWIIRARLKVMESLTLCRGCEDGFWGAEIRMAGLERLVSLAVDEWAE